MRTQLIVGGVCALFFASCGGGLPRDLLPSGDLMDAASVLPNGYRPVTAVRTDFAPEPGGEASYGYVVFRYAPDPTDRRDLELCVKLFAWLHARDSSPSDRVAATYWPATKSVEPFARNCPIILENYDRRFADRVIAGLPASAKWDVFLMAQAPGSFGTPATARVCVDLTAVRDEEHLEAGLSEWTALMSGGPEKWQPKTLADYVHRVLTWFSPHGNVYVDCK